MDKLKEIINYLFSPKNYMTLAIIALTLIVAFEVCNMFILKQYNDWKSLKSDVSANIETLEKLNANKKARDLEEAKSLVKLDNVPVRLYKSSQSGVPVETVSIDFVSTVIQMLESTNNAIFDISYKIDAISEAEKASVPRNVSVVQLTMTLNGKYEDFENFINALYNYKSLATIKSVKMVPLKENKNILTIDVNIWLYISK